MPEKGARVCDGGVPRVWRFVPGASDQLELAMELEAGHADADEA
jgi:hypothetical protein